MSSIAAGGTPTYADFQRPAFNDRRWLETCYFGFYVPEHGIRGHFRAAFRVNQGVVFTLAAIYSRSGGVLDMDLWDSQMHVPMGLARYSDFSLESGFSVKGHRPPDNYTVGFKSRCGRVEYNAEYVALMPPTDTGFSQLAAVDPGFAAFLRPPQGDVSTGHVDQTFRVEGTLRIDKDVYPVSCVANHDHSWSPRAEFKSGCGVFDNLHFGEELTLFTMGSEHPLGQPEITHAYILRGSELRKVRSATVRYERAGFITKALRYEVEDETGERYVIEADVPHAIEQDQGSNGYTVMNYCVPRWEGRTGYGESMWHWDIPKMQGIVRAAHQKDGSTIASAFDALYKAR